MYRNLVQLNIQISSRWIGFCELQTLQNKENDLNDSLKLKLLIWVIL